MNLKELVKKTPATNNQIIALCGITKSMFGGAVYGNVKTHRAKIIEVCETFDMDLQKKLSDLLNDCNHSIPVIAEHSGYSRQSIYRWKKGECAFTQANFKDIVDTVEYLNAK